MSEPEQLDFSSEMDKVSLKEDKPKLKAGWENNKDRIDVNDLLGYFEHCITAEGHVDLETYLVGYRTLYRFFCLLGKVFTFVANDVYNKVNILQEYLDSEEGNHYRTVQSMIAYETENQFPKKPSGSRTLLRLHRALEFVTEFLTKVLELGDDEKTGPAAQDAYKRTLLQHHPWLIQKGALVAMNLLPTSADLVTSTCIQPVSEVRALLPLVLEKSGNVYNITQKTYEEYECLNLP